MADKGFKAGLLHAAKIAREHAELSERCRHDDIRQCRSDVWNGGRVDASDYIANSLIAEATGLPRTHQTSRQKNVGLLLKKDEFFPGVVHRQLLLLAEELGRYRSEEDLGHG